jgi:hypothetical protein
MHDVEGSDDLVASYGNRGVRWIGSDRLPIPSAPYFFGLENGNTRETKRGESRSMLNQRKGRTDGSYILRDHASSQT